MGNKFARKTAQLTAKLPLVTKKHATERKKRNINNVETAQKNRIFECKFAILLCFRTKNQHTTIAKQNQISNGKTVLVC